MASGQVTNLMTQLALSAAGPTNGTAAVTLARAKKPIGILRCLNVNAATTIVAKIQHSADGVTWFDYYTFTSIVGAAGNDCQNNAQDKPILQYVRATVTLSGTTKLADVYIDLACETF